MTKQFQIKVPYSMVINYVGEFTFQVEAETEEEAMQDIILELNKSNMNVHGGTDFSDNYEANEEGLKGSIDNLLIYNQFNYLQMDVSESLFQKMIDVDKNFSFEKESLSYEYNTETVVQCGFGTDKSSYDISFKPITIAEVKEEA